MRVIETVEELQHQTRAAAQRGERVGVVVAGSNMGELTRHVVRAARAQCDFVVLATAVGAAFSRYPSVEADLAWRDPVPMEDHGHHAPLRLCAQIDDRMEHRLLRAIEHAGIRAVRASGVTAADVIYISSDPFHEARAAQQALELCLTPTTVRLIDPPIGADGAPLADGPHSARERADRAAILAALQEVRETAQAGVAAGVMASPARLVARAEAALSRLRDLQIDFLELVDPTTLNLVTDLNDSDAHLVLRGKSSWGPATASVVCIEQSDRTPTKSS